jgi:type IV secretion system protein VirB8
MRRNAAPDNYMLEARSWELDRTRRAERSTRIAWIVSAAATLIAVLAVAAVSRLTPLKQQRNR